MKRITLSEPSQRWVKGNEATFDPSIIYFERSSGWKSVLPRPFQNGGEEGMEGEGSENHPFQVHPETL